ncbi:hypothetical protein [Trichloromonas sp.]|uniref:hypothetical protein n=1 Tax=Trichloromonas sp. TaxID=3069249 RepID=UPI003D819EA0
MAHVKLPRGVIALGLVSLFMDLSSEMIHSLLPISRANLQRLPRRFWWVVVFAAVLTLARFSEAFAAAARAEHGDVRHLGAHDPDCHEPGLRRQCLPLG